MKQTVKTTIRWQDKEGCILGAVRENEIDLPQWGKAHFLRQEIQSFIEQLKEDSKKIENVNCFKAFAMFAFSPDRIVKASCKVVGKQSYVSFKDESLKQFILNCNIN